MTAIAARLTALRSLRPDGAWTAVLVILALLAVLDGGRLLPSLEFALRALWSTLPYILVAVLMIAALLASGAESVIARAFEGREIRMVVLAALLGGLAPFCSCEVIPFIAGLLAVGTPLAPVMAFWLASPLIDPPSLMITAGALGWEFAIAKTVAAIGIGLLGGLATLAITRTGGLANPLRQARKRGCGGCGADPLSGRPVWRFWHEPARRATFRRAAWENVGFLLKWLSLAYLLESLLIAYVPAESIASLVGGPGLLPIVLSALLGAPAYLNAFAAPPLVAGLVEQGMTLGAAMSFMVAGAVTSIPAMTAVFALVRHPVFGLYLVLGLMGAVLSGLVYGLAA